MLPFQIKTLAAKAQLLLNADPSWTAAAGFGAGAPGFGDVAGSGFGGFAAAGFAAAGLGDFAGFDLDFGAAVALGFDDDAASDAALAVGAAVGAASAAAVGAAGGPS